MKDHIEKYRQATSLLLSNGSEFELGEVSEEGVRYPIFKRCPDDVNKMLEEGKNFGSESAIVFNDERVTFSDFYEQVARIASLIKEAGIEKGDRVAIAMRNYPEWLAIFCGIIRAGAVAAPLNSWSLQGELTYLLEDTDPKLVFCDAPRFSLVRDYLDEHGLPAVVVRAEAPIAGQLHASYGQWLDGFSGYRDAVSCDGSDTVMIMYSSGTTGYPKGIIWSHRTLAQALFSFRFLGAQMTLLEPDAVEHFSRKNLQPANLLAVPLFHFNGLGATSLLSLMTGQKIVMMYKWDPQEALRLIEREHVTGIRVSPAMALELLESSSFGDTDTSSIFAVGSGGSATPSRLHELVRERLPDVIGSGGYGTTETGIGVSAIVGKAYVDNPRCSGFIGPLSQVKVCDENGSALPAGEIGEIWVRSIATVSAGYWKRPEETADAFRDGWYLTGDVGYLDENELLYITDRIKDMVIRGGENIYCTEVENAVYQFDVVAEAVAFGIPHDVLGEELAVAIVCTKNSIFNPDVFRDFMSRRIAHYKVPRHVFVFNAPLPRGPSGKFLKKDVRASCVALVR